MWGDLDGKSPHCCSTCGVDREGKLMGAPNNLSSLSSDAVDEAKRLLQQGAISEAVAKLDNLLTGRPDDSDALYILAVAKRYSGEITQA